MESAIQLIHSINKHIINPVIQLMFAAAVLVFIFGIFEYFKNAASSDARVTGRNNMIAGVIGMFIMISVFGIIRIVLNTVGASETETGVSEIIQR